MKKGIILIIALCIAGSAFILGSVFIWMHQSRETVETVSLDDLNLEGIEDTKIVTSKPFITITVDPSQWKDAKEGSLWVLRLNKKKDGDHMLFDFHLQRLEDVEIEVKGLVE